MDRPRTRCRLAVAVLCVFGGSTVVSRGQCPMDWLPHGGLPGASGTIQVAEVCDLDGSGPQPPILVVGGDFSSAGTIPADNIAAWDGAFWSTFGGGLNNEIFAATVFDDGTGPRLYAGGSDEMQKWDGFAWSYLSGFPNVQFFTVFSLAEFDDGSGKKLYAGGSYFRYPVPVVTGLARWDGETWEVPYNSFSPRQLTVYDLGDGPGLYGCGGSVRRWNGTEFAAVAGGTVSGVAVMTAFDDGTGPALYAGGTFTTIGGVPANHIAKWRDGVWSAVGSGVAGPSATVSGLAVVDYGDGPALYVSGIFTSAGGLPANNLAKWDGTAWSVLQQENNGIRTLDAYRDGEGAPALYALGRDPVAQEIARWTGQAWASPDSAGVNGAINVLTTLDDGTGPALYAGGRFTEGFGTLGNRIARWDGAVWSPIGAGLLPAGGTLPSAVNDLISFDEGIGAAIYAGGRFANPGTTTPVNVARWDGIMWSGLGEFVDTVNAIAFYDSGAGPELYGGGGGSSGGHRIAQWDGAAWVAVGGGIPGSSSVVRSLTVYDDGQGPGLYAAGRFVTAGTVTANNIARWDGSAWTSLGTGITRTSGTIDVYKLIVFDDGTGPALYAAGRFSHAGAEATANVARWDGAHWSSVGGGLSDGGSNQIVQSLRVADDGSGPALFAVGTLVTPGGPATVAKLSGGSWVPVANVTSGTVRDIASFDDADGPTIHLGGDLMTISGQINAYWARLAQECPLGDVNCDSVVDFSDIDPFVLALLEPAGYVAAHPNCEIANADTNADGLVNFFDIDGFLACLFSTCP